MPASTLIVVKLEKPEVPLVIDETDEPMLNVSRFAALDIKPKSNDVIPFPIENEVRPVLP